jgi:hypothetical protein
VSESASPTFKGWTKPGPVPPGAASPVNVPEEESLDAISGHFRIFQLKRGHRFSTDDVLTAWYGTTWSPAAARPARSGIGHRLGRDDRRVAAPGACVVSVEAQDESVTLARKSAAYNGLIDRYEIRHADFRSPASLDADERFDWCWAAHRTVPWGVASKASIRKRWRAGSSCVRHPGLLRRRGSASGAGRPVRVRLPEEQRGAWNQLRATRR